VAATIETDLFNAEKLKGYIPEIRGMTLQDPDVFLPRLREIFSDCGVAFVILPYLKNSGINGAVKWINQDRVVLAMNDRRLNADTFWFSLFHEIKHVLQQKTRTVFISSNKQEMKAIDDKLEAEADFYAQNILIPAKEYHRFAPTKYTSDAEIAAFAKEIGIHPGIVAGRLQHDRIIAPNRCTNLKQQYKIVL
jgi:Zn-dependent peptidase ImmA (M78 family)